MIGKNNFLEIFFEKDVTRRNEQHRKFGDYFLTNKQDPLYISWIIANVDLWENQSEAHIWAKKAFHESLDARYLVIFSYLELAYFGWVEDSTFQLLINMDGKTIICSQAIKTLLVWLYTDKHDLLNAKTKAKECLDNYDNNVEYA